MPIQSEFVYLKMGSLFWYVQRRSVARGEQGDARTRHGVARGEQSGARAGHGVARGEQSGARAG
ncbi:hypothetical protein, partial [Geomicrobium sp. JCM 19038]|uniref:hypothetical protein n=1 Tax=Geomicrobium sp. JCM 19038 TaxID=1460635 RepID=UPI0005A665FF